MSEEQIRINIARINELFNIIKKICPHKNKKFIGMNFKNENLSERYYCYDCQNWVNE